MAFWSDVTTEPKRQFRWYFILGGGTAAPNEKIETYAIKTVKKPSFSISEVPHQYVAHTFYYPGRVTWNPVDITFVDPVAPDHSAVISNLFVRAGYTPPREQTLAETSLSKSKFVASVGTPVITQIDADGNDIERWTLNNAFFTSIDYGQLDYGSEEMVINSVTIRYDYATQEIMPLSPSEVPSLLT